MATLLAVGDDPTTCWFLAETGLRCAGDRLPIGVDAEMEPSSLVLPREYGGGGPQPPALSCPVTPPAAVKARGER